MTEKQRAKPEQIKYKKGFFAVENLPVVNDNVKLIKGLFQETLANWLVNHQIQNIKLLHIDSDLYSSAKYVLDILNKSIVANTCIIFDELCFFNDPKGPKFPLYKDGEFRALKEWTEENNRSFEILSRSSGMQCCIRIIN